MSVVHKMKRNLLLAAVVFLLAVSAVYSVYSLKKERSEIHMPVQADEALSILVSNEEANAFISEYLTNESNRTTRVNLKWDPETDSYVWDIELMERTCACKVGSIEGLNVLRAQIDPITGAVLNVTARTGVKEETLSRERCEEGCHDTGEALLPNVHSEV